ncbi:glycosyltransferase [Alteromonas sp. ASW11-19]|uniref:Glycosyltransferase n=1 Tax=Alteromonas salexigens TaxID=2982530 RepID=A0ABT2VK58_9ALTE|nr:glycosyltransferase [Alteromonas salexigens]MCU7553653.1 glycosyltransferase [Alteromonas salexigens]
MELEVVIEKRFYRCREQKVWTENAFPYAFWLRYLSVFSTLTIIARVHEVNEPQSQWQQVTGEGVELVALPGYVGPTQFLRALPKTLSILRKRRNRAGRTLYRVPGILSWLHQLIVRPSRGSYAVEVVGDPADTFAKGASSGALRPVIKAVFTSLLRYQCRHAGAVSYVTRAALQQRYPPGQQAYHTHYSSICLHDDDYKKVSTYTISRPPQLLCIGNLSQPYKGCDTMLQALQLFQQQRHTVQLTWVGGGSLQLYYEALAEKLGVAHMVTFMGNVACRARIRQLIDACDLFVLPSRQEGLPRVLIEAMARSRLCVATQVGGVPELLPADRIVARDDPAGLMRCIQASLAMSAGEQLAEANGHYQRAQDYHDSQLQQRRVALYHTLRQLA